MKYILGLFILVITMYAQPSSAMITQVQADTANARLLRSLTNDTTLIARGDSTIARLLRLLEYYSTDQDTVIGGTATTNWVQLGSLSAKNGFDIINPNSSGEIYIGYTSNPTYYITIYPQTGYTLPKANQLSDMYIKGSSSLTYIVVRK